MFRSKLGLMCLVVFAIFPGSMAGIAGVCATGETGNDNPCDWTNYEYEYHGTGGSVANCGGCDFDWTWTVTQLDPERVIITGNSHDHVKCGTTGTTHVIDCPNGGGPAVCFGTTCGSCQ